MVLHKLLQLYNDLINDILYNSTKEKYFNFSVYVNLIKLLLPKILKLIFKNPENIPNYFIQNIDEMFKIWKNRWEIFDDKFCKGFFMYTYNYNTYNKIEEYYEPCYKTCASCEYGGDGNNNNCTSCDIDHIFDPWKTF